MRFEDRSVRGQVARLRPLAVEVLRRYSIDVAALRLLNHGFNTTFRVDTTDGRRFALRLNVNSRRTDSFIGAEMAWLAALAEETDLWVPIPQRTLDGALLTHVRSLDLGRSGPPPGSGTQTAPAGCPGRSRAGRACSWSGTPTAG